MELSQGDMFIIERETKHGVRSRQLAEYVKESSLAHEGGSFPVMKVLVGEL